MATSSTTRRAPQRRNAGSRGHRRSRLLVVALEVPIGVGGVFGGWHMLRHPLNPLGLTPDLIAGTPFGTYHWPGVLLLILVGVPPLVLTPAVLARARGAIALSALYGVGLMAWIVDQWVLLDDRLWLQPVIFALGAALAVTAGRARHRGAR